MQARSVLQSDGTARVYRNDAYRRGRNWTYARKQTFVETNQNNLLLSYNDILTLIFNLRLTTYYNRRAVHTPTAPARDLAVHLELFPTVVMGTFSISNALGVFLPIFFNSMTFRHYFGK